MTIRWLLLVCAIVMTGCASREVLPTHANRAPADVNFSGQWSLRSGQDDSNRRLRDAEVSAAGGERSLYGKPRRRRGDDDSLVHIFVETGKNLKITQTASGLFISFDRAVVEEYRFGEYRPISVGPVTADRSSGWDGNVYVIETLDKQGNKLSDRYQLEGSGEVLVRQISIYKNRKLDMSVVQTFDKK